MDGEPRTTTSTFTQRLSAEGSEAKHANLLPCQTRLKINAYCLMFRCQVLDLTQITKLTPARRRGGGAKTQTEGAGRERAVSYTHLRAHET